MLSPRVAASLVPRFTVASLLIAASAGSVFAQYAPNTVGDYIGAIPAGTGYSSLLINNLAPGTMTNLNIYQVPGDPQNDPTVSYDNVKNGTGAVTDSFHLLPNVGVTQQAPGSYAGGSATASDVSGTLHSYAFADSASTQDGYGGSAASTVSSLVADSITLSKAATVTLSGTLEGNLYATSNAVASAVNMSLLFINPTTDEDGDVSAYGGYTVQVTDGGMGTGSGSGTQSPYASTLNQYPFSVNVPLPAGTSFFYGSLWTFAIAEQGNYIDGDNTVVYYGGTAYADFGHTLNFGVSVPQGVTASSSSGLIPITSASAAEPGTLCLLLGSVGALFPVAVRRRSVS